MLSVRSRINPFELTSRASVTIAKMRIDGRKKKICRYDPPLARENENKRNSRIPVSTRKDDPRAGLCQSARRKREKTRARENGKAEGGGADACNRGGGGLHRVILFLSLAAVASSSRENDAPFIADASFTAAFR